MKVLLQGRSRRSVESSPGGDQVQLEQTATALARDFGVDAHVSFDTEPRLNGFDLVHLFGVVRPQEAWIRARNARRQRKPIVLSPVYCDTSEFDRVARGGATGLLARTLGRDAIEALKALGRGANSGEWTNGVRPLLTRGFTSMQREIVAMSSVFLPNSRSEWRRMTADLSVRVPDDRVIVVPNAPSMPDVPTALQSDSRLASLLPRLRGCILSVARIEGRKNQLNLIRAIRGTEFTLALAGAPAANQQRYVAQVRREALATANVFLLGYVSVQEKLALYRAATVHALPSWMETTGLSSLEAASLDCGLVVTDKGDARDYFGDHAHYCDPDSPASIQAALQRAARTGPSGELARRISAEFTWRRAAEASLAGYEKAMAVAGEPRSHLAGVS
jgi:glycosyltransferase involved in cell wall biosynthesis